MLNLIATIDNHITQPSPALDDSPEGYHLEDRLQVTVKSPVNDRTYTVEFRIGEGVEAPSTQQLNEWMEAGELVRVLCTTVTARPFDHKEGKQYRNRGTVREINGKEVELDALIIFAGQSIALASTPFDAEEAVRKARGAFKKQQRVYREALNARRVEQTKAGMAERVAKLKAAQAKRTAAAELPPAADSGAAAMAPESGTSRKR